MSVRTAVEMLRPEHAEHLARFRIPPEMLKAAAIRSVTDIEGRETLGLHGYQGADLGGILFSYLSPLRGARVGGRIRLDHALPEDGGKYISEPGCRHLFFAPCPKEWLTDTSIPVVFVESEKAALALSALAKRAGRKLLMVAIGGCWGWRRKIGKRALPDGGSQPETGPSPDLDLIAWEGRSVILAFDSNASTNSDVRWARRRLAQELEARGATVLIAEIPAIEGVNGPDDLIAVSGDGAILGVLDSAQPTREKRERESLATDLVKLALDLTELFHSGDDCYATFAVAEHRETHAMNSRGFRRWLMKMFFERQKRAASGEVIKSTIATLEGFARFKREERDVFVRVARHDGKIYLDLCDEHWRAVEIAKHGWRVIESKDCPVRFRHAHGMLALPVPERGGKIGELRRFLNCCGDTFLLLVGWLIGAFHPRGPYPVLILHGELRLREDHNRKNASQFGRP